MCRWCHCKHDDLAEHIHNFDGDDVHEPWTIDEYNKIAENLPKKQVEDCGHTQLTGVNLFDEYDEPEDGSDEESDEESVGEDSDEETDNYGMKSECVFNILRSFHCVTSMPPDCLHDLFEGVLAQDLLGIIRILKIKGWFSCEDYNVALKRFPLSTQEASNKPQPVPLKNSVKKLPGKAVSVWCHARCFFSILSLNGWVRDPEDLTLKLALLLIDITDRVTAERFEEYEIDRLEDIVIEYLDLRKVVMEEYPLLGSAKPKHHFLSHYAQNIRQFGPPMGFWTGRYESKHRVAKAVAISSKNFRNISLTVSNRQQLRMASTLYHGIYPKEEFSLPVLVQKRSDLSDSDLEANLKAFVGEEDLVCIQIVWRERTYREGLIVVISRKDLIEMKVGVIKTVLVKRGEVYLLVRRATVIQNSFKVFETDTVEDNLVFVNIKHLQDTYPLFKRGSDEKYFVIPHHHISFKYE